MARFFVCTALLVTVAIVASAQSDGDAARVTPAKEAPAVLSLSGSGNGPIKVVDSDGSERTVHGRSIPKIVVQPSEERAARERELLRQEMERRRKGVMGAALEANPRGPARQHKGGQHGLSDEGRTARRTDREVVVAAHDIARLE